MDKSEKTIIGVVIGIVTGCILISVMCVVVYQLIQKLNLDAPLIPEIATPAMPTQTTCSAPIVAALHKVYNPDDPVLVRAEETKWILANTEIPAADLNEMAVRLFGRTSVATHLETPPVEYTIGDRLDFYKLDGDNNSIHTVATLRYATENVYFWAEEDLQLEKRDVKTLVDIFANEIYPTNHAFFGTENIPGVDNDPHLYILYARGLGDSLAGYFSSEDIVLPEAVDYANGHEMFVINADEDALTDSYTLSTMAHEMQHLILGYRDPNEELWLNEGFSELATLINGYDAGGFDYSFTLQPDMQLNNWSSDPDLNDLNYGASYMYTTYLLGRFGSDFTRALVADPLNGFTSIDHLFESREIKGEDGSPYSADELFRDWTLANFINDPNMADGRYYYSEYPEVPTINDTEWLANCRGEMTYGSVNQYGTDYYTIGCSLPYTLNFTGWPTVNILPDNGENQTYFMWSNRADFSDMTLTKEFDFAGINDSIVMQFDTWHDLESDFDYTYLLISVDGVNWQMLNAGACETYNTYKGSYDCGFNGATSGWQPEEIDLSAYAGQRIFVRFESVSDSGISNEGFAIDNIRIPVINYAEDFESGDGGWVGMGYSRIQNSVSQTFLVSLITSDPNNPVQKYLVNADEELILQIDPNCYESNPVLVISGNSRFTRQLAEYTITLSE